ncbi:hypothetical protein GF339_16430 [candidate division KSB3 bacterium]|uniref:RXYLT1 C-terminal domain-containing protein n=1 Tax=candidate division KSB3 bacterium TaxID=2044937 RepID=A0A9D5Q6U7_9BACT|nr:hypothetical protein [candidate division KSB3 bacterium]MBD3326175.1 hypothetical protein [candidate division KSB3 bacterium]
MNRLRVLFLRADSNAEGSARIVNGLLAYHAVEFEQYPALPAHYRYKVKTETEWQDLHRHLIPTRQDFLKKLQQAHFDLILLADKGGSLFEYERRSTLGKIWGILKLWANVPNYGIAETIRRYAYLSAIDITPQALCRLAPVVVVDLNDIPYLKPGMVEVLQECKLYFKREVPYNRFGIYHSFRSAKYRTQETLALLKKIRHIPLGILDSTFDELSQMRTPSQDIDVFWVGQMSSTIRVKVSQYLRELASQNRWKIVIPQERLSFEEYCRMVARSKITVSVEGDGWDCFRHYEAVALGSLPLINTPTVDAAWWHKMPKDIYFDNDFSNFTDRIQQLLDDEALRKACLQKMETVIKHHMVWSKIIQYIVNTSVHQSSQINEGIAL